MSTTILSFDDTPLTDALDYYLDPENENGNVEYKYTLIDSNYNTLNARASQLNFRILEGNGMAIVYIGVTDNGYQLGLIKDTMQQSFNNFNTIIAKIDVHITQIQVNQVICPIEESYKQLYLSYNPPPENQDESNIKDICKAWKIRPIPDSEYLQHNRYVAKIYISRETNTARETRIIVLGSVDAGKSSLIGVLTKNKLDDGNGSARSSVFNHLHEIQSGRTSSISQQLLGLNSDGKIVNTARISRTELVSKSHRIVTLYDLAGHLKYLNTTIKGVCGTYSDYALVMVGGNMGITEMTKEHIILAYLHKLPMCIIVTKVDIAPEKVLANTITLIRKLLKSVNYQTILIKSESDLELYFQKYHIDIVPIIQISNVTGQNVNILTEMLNKIPNKNDFAKKILEPFYYTINEIFSVSGVGTVISGLVMSGKTQSKVQHWIGPLSDGKFKKITIRSIQNKQINVDKCQADQFVTFSIRGIDRSDIIKGMVLIDGTLPGPLGKRRFTAKLSITGKHSTSIKEFYEPVIHIGNIKQSAKILSIEKQATDPNATTCIRTGDTAIVEFEFKYYPVHLLPNTVFMFREQKIKGHGIIMS